MKKTVCSCLQMKIYFSGVKAVHAKNNYRLHNVSHPQLFPEHKLCFNNLTVKSAPHNGSRSEDVRPQIEADIGADKRIIVGCTSSKSPQSQIKAANEDINR